MTLKEIGAILHTARRADGQYPYLRHVKAELGMHEINVSQIERGIKRRVQFATLEKLCDLFGYELVLQKREETRDE